MPNWCLTSYKLSGKASEIADLHEKLTELQSIPKPLIQNGFGNLFLGCLINYLGGDYTNVDCRGEIDSLELCGENMIQLTTTTAWGDKSEVWDFVCKKYPSITYYYLSEEPGMGYYINSDESDEYFPEKYIINDWVNGSVYVNNDEELFKKMAECLEVDSIENFEQLHIHLKLYNEDHLDEMISYHQFDSPNQ